MSALATHPRNGPGDRRGRTRPVLLGASALALVGCAVARGGSPPPTTSADPDGTRLPTADLVLGFDQPVVPGDEVPGTSNDGTAAVEVAVVTANGGRLTWASGPVDGGAVRTPAYTPEGPVRGAAIVVWPNPATPDPLSPGTADFEFGLDLWADPVQVGRPGDDGENLIQRGRFDQTAQFKLQVDHGIPSCRVAGSLGEVVLEAEREVLSDRWYRLTCARSGGTVRMDLVDLSGQVEPEQWSVVADVGELTFTDVPLSIGAKLTTAGRIDSTSADQFHGTIDRVFFDVH